MIQTLDLDRFARSDDMNLIHSKNTPETSLSSVIGILLNDMFSDKYFENPDSHMNAINHLQGYQRFGYETLADISKNFKQDHLHYEDMFNANLERNYKFQ